MWKKFLPLFVAAGILAGGVYLYRHRHVLFRPSFDRGGGTLVAFAVDGEPPAGGLAEAVEGLLRRFDPTGSRGLVVRAGEGEVEVGVPAGADHDELLDRIKRLAPVSGPIDFRILANGEDDDQVLRTARFPVTDPPARAKLPPPPPRQRGSREFTTTLPGEPTRTYSWVRLGEAEVRGLGLLGASTRQQVERALDTGEGVTLAHAAEATFTARKVEGRPDPAIYVLTREEPEDRAVTGELIERAQAGSESGGRRPAVLVRFTLEGGERMAALTGPAVRRSMLTRRLAVIVHEEAVTLPMLHTAWGRQATITGSFGREQAEDLACLLRCGELPVRLKPTPARETAVVPGR